MGSNNSKGKLLRGKAVIRPLFKVALDEVKKCYKVDSATLGKGAFGKVFKAESLTDESYRVAIKELSKVNMNKKDIIDLGNEVQILNQLDHPNICKYYEVYEDKKYLYLVMEYWSGSNLYEKLTYQGIKYTETDCAKMTQQLLLALHHCHSSKVTHRDIKLENIMITDDNIIKLIDFGLSKTANKEELMKSMSGTPYYMAPEVFDEDNYGPEVDLWSLGVVLFTCLGGYRPFVGKNIKEIYKNIIEGNYKFHPREWSWISRDAKDLISMMLTRDPKKRITAELALQHPWFGLITDIKLDRTIKKEQKVRTKTLKRLKSFKQFNALKRWAIELLINMLSVDEKQYYETEFNKFDTTHSGIISGEEFMAKIKDSDEEVNQKIKKIFKENQVHWFHYSYARCRQGSNQGKTKHNIQQIWRWRQRWNHRKEFI
jgi:calcium-dependent protein kinase